MDERRNDSETMRRENRRIQAMSWGPTDDMMIPPLKPCRPMGDSSYFTSNSDELLNQEVGTLKITECEGATADLPQTYIIAQNPEILARLLAENDSRGINPSFYTTPASVFNTLAVDVDEQKTMKHQEVPLKTCKIPASEILKLDPVANENDQIDSANSSRANTFDRYAQSYDLCSSSSSTMAASASQSTLGSDTGYQTLSKTPPNLASFLESRKNSLPRQLSTESGNSLNMTGSLDRRPIVPPRTNLPGSQINPQPTSMASRSKGGSLERNQSMSGAYDLMRSRVYRGGSLERNQANGITVARSGSLERNPNYLAYRTQMKANIENEPVQEEIYDFGGAHLKSCASIALNKGIAKGMIPPGTQLLSESPQPPQHSNNPFLQNTQQLPQQPPTVMYNIMSMSQPNSLGMPLTACSSPMSMLSGSYPQAIPIRPFIKSPQPELHSTPQLMQFQIASGMPMAQMVPVEQPQVRSLDSVFLEVLLLVEFLI